MLKGIDPVLGPELLAILRGMGHGDEIAVVDGNYPAETDAKRLVRMDGHDAPRIVEAILSVMPVDEFVPEAVFRPAAGGDAKRMEPVFSDFEKSPWKIRAQAEDHGAGGLRFLQPGEGLLRHRGLG